MNLRPYQQAISDSVMREWREVNSTLVVAPTGCGKTVIFADIIRRMRPMRAMVIAHREELVWQARDKIMRVSGLVADIEMSDVWADEGQPSPVVVSTVQTQNSAWGDQRRMGRFDPRYFGVLILDECHHAAAKTYLNLIHYYTQNPDLRVLGVTATPDRSDEKALGRVFQTVAFDYEILDAINDGWLVPVDQMFIHINGLDYSHIRTTAGDLNGADLARVMEEETNLQGVAGASLELIGPRKTIVFTASVRQAEVICNIFNRYKDGMAEWVCGKTNRDSRRSILDRFREGDLQVVCNCGVLTEGFDNPNVEVIVMARPTKSRSLYAQMCGRAMRPLTGLVDEHEDNEQRKAAILNSPKPAMMVVDFVGNSGRHKLINSGHILGGRVSEQAIQRVMDRAKQGGVPVRISEEAEEEEKLIREETIRRKQEAEARKARLVAKVKYRSQPIDPFDALEISPRNERGWDKGKTLSEKQKLILLRQGMDPDKMTYVQARQMVTEIFRRWKGKLCTLGQARVLKRFGYHTQELTYEQAKHMIDRIAANHWRKPQDEQTPTSKQEPSVPSMQAS